MSNFRGCSTQRSVFGRLLAVFAVVFVLTGCNEDRYGFPVVGTYPTAIDYWPAKKMLLVGTLDGAVYSMTRQGGREKKMFEVGAIDQPQIIRLRVDRNRDRLWVLGPYHLSVYDLATSRLLHRTGLLERPGGDRLNPFGDIELDEDGNAYVIDAGIFPVIYKADGVTFGITAMHSQQTGQRVMTKSASYAPLNALAMAPDGARLIYVNGFDGRLWSVGLRDGGVTEIKLSHPLYGASAMAVAREDAVRPGEFKVYVTRASRDMVSVVHLDDSTGGGMVWDLPQSGFDTPLAATVVDGALFVANSQLGRRSEFGGAGDVISPFQILYLGPTYLAANEIEPGPASTIVRFP